jgi:hypothetical protein
LREEIATTFEPNKLLLYFIVTMLLHAIFRQLLPQFGLAEDELGILSGFPIYKINIHHNLEMKGEDFGVKLSHTVATIFTHHVYDIDVPEKESDVSKEMDTTTEESCNSTAADNSASLEDGEPLTKRKRKPKHFNKPLTQEVCR